MTAANREGTKRSSLRSRIVSGYLYPSSVFSKRAQARLQSYWWQTYAFIAVFSNIFIVFAIYIVEPRYLPPTNSLFIIIAPILSTILVSEYSAFLRDVHQRTLQIYDTAPCALKLQIISVHRRRRLLTFVSFAMNFAFAGASLLGVNVSFLTAGIPYFFTLNATLLLNFHLSPTKELDGVFEALPQLNKLSRTYQTMVMTLLKSKIKKRLAKQMPLAGELNPNSFLRMFYLEHSIPTQPSPQITKLSADLKTALVNNGDLFGLLNQRFPQTVTVPDNFSFQLPWEKKVNRERLFLILLATPEIIVALFQLGVFLHVIP